MDIKSIVIHPMPNISKTTIFQNTLHNTQPLSSQSTTQSLWKVLREIPAKWKVWSQPSCHYPWDWEWQKAGYASFKVRW